MADIKQHSILIVDDDRNSRESLAAYLSDDYIIFKASDGNEALNLLREKKEIALVLSDVDMPSMDGIELFHSIKHEKRQVKLIFVSSSRSLVSAAKGEMSGAYAYLSKPVDLNQLTMTVESALREHNSG